MSEGVLLNPRNYKLTLAKWLPEFESYITSKNHYNHSDIPTLITLQEKDNYNNYNKIKL